VLSTEFPSRNGLNPEVLRRASEFIEQEFQAIGFKAQSQWYPARGGDVRNLVVEKIGTEPDLSCIIIGAHYDTVLGTPGADDNASGVAGLIELARLLRSYTNRRTLRFVAFPHEEPPYFFTSQMGSRVYARQLKRDKVGVQIMLTLEMIGYGGPEMQQTYPFPFLKRFGGYPEHGNYIALVGNIRTRKIVKIVRQAMRDACSIGVESLTAPGFLPPLYLSDHSSFWKYGFSALMVTDTAFQRNPYYHRAGDTAETLNYEFLAEVVVGVRDAVTIMDRM
jgi:Zn-dependent M28 family amino/carboxypeptidase